MPTPPYGERPASTTAAGRAPWPPATSSARTRSSSPLHGLDLSVYGGAAGIVSTPADLVRWDLALRIPGLLLSRQTRSTRCSRPVRDGNYGLGWIVSQEHGQTIVGHPGGVEGFNAAIARYLGDGITVIALANTEAIDCRNVLDAVSAIAHGEAVDPFPEPVEVPVSPAMFSRFLGDFVLTPRPANPCSRSSTPRTSSLMNT
jgi:CubicO group peptidase (beta-lactamase class C family)